MNREIEFVVHTLCLTYNHESYIEDALKGFAMQKTEFPVLSIIIDDASTDRTVEVLNRFLKDHFSLDDEDAIDKEMDYGHVTFARHKSNANCFFYVVCLKENHYSRSKTKFKYYKEWTKTKYAAMCEGDDYWTDPLKLQKQVDFMEAHEDYSLCFTNSIVRKQGEELKAINAVWDTYSIEDIIASNALNMAQRGDHVASCGHTSTILYRAPKKPLPAWVSKCFIGDEPLFIALGQYGKAKFLNEVTSVYREGVGVSSNNFSFEKDWKNRIKMYQIINKGLNYKYSKIINPIIKEYKLKVFKLLWKGARKREAISFAINALKRQ